LWQRLEAVVFCGETDSLKFLADGMLGKLTRWLRMLGQDVSYSTDVEDSQLLNIAKSEKRILLTRDFELYQRTVGKGIESFYVQGDTSKEKLAELAHRFGISLEMDMSASRCPKCNAKVKPVSAEKAAEKVQKNTFVYYKEFWQCPKCGQVYWQGSHWVKIKKTLRDADEIDKVSKKKEN
jgi:uncharacterized protein with PIN domain